MTPNQIETIIKRIGATSPVIDVNGTKTPYISWRSFLDSVFLRHEHYPKGTVIKIYPDGYDFAITFES